MASVVGRERELSLAEEFLDSAGERFAVLALEGEAGAGKTTLWREIVRRAGERRFLVLSSRPAESEAKLALSALADLLEPVPDETLASLSGPRRRALEVALLHADAGKARVHPRTLAAAVRSVLGELGSARPLLVAVDDVQWLDAASASTLEFALRRLTEEPVGFLATRRVREPLRLKLDDLATAERVARVTVGPLSLAALHHVLAQALGEPPSRSTLVRIHQASGGNPLFALEIARLLDETGVPPPGEPLPVPADVRELVRRRVTMLPGRTREALLAAAALADPREDVVCAALGRPVSADLDPAERRGMAALERGAVVFAHPLFPAAVYSSATSAERRAVHRRLASVLDDPEARARHLALAAEGRDDAAAAAVHAAAAGAARRGAPAAAAELAQLALALTEPESEQEPPRVVELAYYLHAAGESERAQAVLQAVDTWERWPPKLHARAVDFLGEVMSYTRAAAETAELAKRAAAQAPSAEVRAAWDLVVSHAEMQFDVPRSLEHVDAALALLEPLGDAVDPVLLASALTVRVRAEAVNGQGIDARLVERILALEARLPRDYDPPSASLGGWLRWVDDLATSRQLLERNLEWAVESGNEPGRAAVLRNLAATECLAGQLTIAREHATTALTLAEELGTGELERMAAETLALVDVYLGNAAEARELLGEMSSLRSDVALGLLELSLGQDEAADRHLRAALEAIAEAGIREPGIDRVHGDAAEAAVALGDLDRAERIADALDEHGERTYHRWSLATAARVRALVAAARGDLDAALADCERALAHHEELPMPLERARTLLVAGRVERRARRRGRAKQSFEQALAIFEEAGARLWADRARAELDRVGLRRGSPDELTENERLVAELAASGMTNREVGAALHLSPKTVSANLSRVYHKLGIASRAELGARMSERVQT